MRASVARSSASSCTSSARPPASVLARRLRLIGLDGHGVAELGGGPGRLGRRRPPPGRRPSAARPRPARRPRRRWGGQPSCPAASASVTSRRVLARGGARRGHGLALRRRPPLGVPGDPAERVGGVVGEVEHRHVGGAHGRDRHRVGAEHAGQHGLAGRRGPSGRHRRRPGRRWSGGGPARRPPARCRPRRRPAGPAAPAAGRRRPASNPRSTVLARSRAPVPTSRRPRPARPCPGRPAPGRRRRRRPPPGPAIPRRCRPAPRGRPPAGAGTTARGRRASCWASVSTRMMPVWPTRAASVSASRASAPSSPSDG